jgi:uncharacterized protein YcsI (UPF0317 family)
MLLTISNITLQTTSLWGNNCTGKKGYSEVWTEDLVGLLLGSKCYWQEKRNLQPCHLFKGTNVEVGESSPACVATSHDQQQTKSNSVAFSLQANYTDR